MQKIREILQENCKPYNNDSDNTNNDTEIWRYTDNKQDCYLWFQFLEWTKTPHPQQPIFNFITMLHRCYHCTREGSTTINLNNHFARYGESEKMVLRILKWTRHKISHGTLSTTSYLKFLNFILYFCKWDCLISLLLLVILKFQCWSCNRNLIVNINIIDVTSKNWDQKECHVWDAYDINKQSLKTTI